MGLRLRLTGGLLSLFVAGVATGQPPVGSRLERVGDEIVVCGQFVHTQAPVVLWLDPGGYDAYRVERRFVVPEEAGWEASREAGLRSPVRYGSRVERLPAEEAARVLEEGWDLATLQRVVDQFVIHYDVCGTSRRCFQILHDVRGLSVHFLLDVDGTIYQTLDLKEAAWHATVANGRSIGIEIAHIGAYPVGEEEPADRVWYEMGRDGSRLRIPETLASHGFRNPAASFAPARREPVVGTIQGTRLRQYDFTAEQYESLGRLTAALCATFPKLPCDYPREEDGTLVRRKLADERYETYEGLLGHFHVQSNKIDPGPAFDWERLIATARAAGAHAAP